MLSGLIFFLTSVLIPRYQGYIGAALVLGGVDVTGPHLYSIYPHGSTDKLPYVTMGEYYVFFDNKKLQNCVISNARKCGIFTGRTAV